MFKNKFKGNISLAEIAEKIKQSRQIIMTAHVNPDGDALGTLLAMFHIINEYNKKYVKNIEEYISCDIVIDDKLPRYMDKFEEKKHIKEVKDIDKDKNYDLFISVDCANAERYGSAVIFKDKAKESINIDHHISNTEHAQFNFVEDISSTAELIFPLIEIFGVEMTKKIGDFLYLGIINDTGNFRHDNVTENTFRVCAETMKAGTSNYEIANIIFQVSENKINILGDVYKNKVVDSEYKFKYYYLTREKIEEYNLSKDDTDGIAEMLLKIEGTELALFMREENGIIKGSFRANDIYNVNEIASLFNGGGHIKAAGFKTELKLEEIMKRLYEYLEKNYKL